MSRGKWSERDRAREKERDDDHDDAERSGGNLRSRCDSRFIDYYRIFTGTDLMHVNMSFVNLATRSLKSLVILVDLLIILCLTFRGGI